jgi:AmmeMemoRadiSam system protein A/AmmeMemoRadiSam system protein B
MSITCTFLVPHPPVSIKSIGKQQTQIINKTIEAYNKVAQDIYHLKPETIVIITPHSTIYSDYFHISGGESAVGSFESFGEKDISFNVTYDTELAETIASICATSNIQAGSLGNGMKELDHGTMVPLYHINKYYKDFKIVRISVSDYSIFTHYEFGKCISHACDNLNRKVVLLASGDLSHYLTNEGPYGYRTEGPIYDSMMMDMLKSTSFLDLFKFNHGFVAKAGTCAHKPIAILCGALDGYNVTSELYSYEGQLGVGYGICKEQPDITKPFCPERTFDLIYKREISNELNLRKLDENPYVKLARITVEELILNNRFLTLNEINTFVDEYMLENTAGVFVSIKKNGDIRGCVGTICATTGCIAHEIVNNAINACYNDPRFVPVSVDELPYLTYSIDVLEEPELVESVTELDVAKYGIIVTCNEKRGLLLPNLESIKTPYEQVEVALKKAHINFDEEYSIQRFEVTRYN